MNIKSNLLVAAALLASGFGFTSTALAGEGGVAGSAAFQLTNSVVDRASVAVAVGKTTAYAGASTTGSVFETAAFATGTGGALTTSGAEPYSITTISEEGAVNLARRQENTITQSVDINVPAALTEVTPPPTFFFPFLN